MLRLKLHLKKSIDRLKSNLKSSVYALIFTVLYMFLAMFVIFLFPLLFSRDYELIINIAEFAIIGSGTLAILTFTYALVKGDRSGKYNNIVISGELLLKSTLTFIIGLGLLPGVGLMLKSPNPISSFLGMFAEYYETLTSIVTVLILLIGVVSLVLSVVFFARGIRELIELLRVY